MDALRWILLFLGAIILIAIYLFGKRAESRRAAERNSRDEPQFNEKETTPVIDETETAADDEWDIIPIPPRGESGLHESGSAREVPEAIQGAEQPEESTTPGKDEPVPSTHSERASPENPSEDDASPSFDEVLIMHVVSQGGPFRGGVLAEAFGDLGLTLDERGIYVRRDDHGTDPLFGVVNMVKPGIFSPDTLGNLETPGISLFLTLPGPELPMVAFREMKDCAKRLAERLPGRLEDETHSTLSPQTLAHMEERVRQFIQHRARLQGIRQ